LKAISQIYLILVLLLINHYLKEKRKKQEKLLLLDYVEVVQVREFVFSFG